nr:putative retrotransposon Ty1-copia subclass protein [Tanacetum cinerariifolium]
MKTGMDGKVHIYKARLVAKGCTETYDVDYEETFSPVADIRAIRILIAIAAYYDYEIWQMDVKIAFLNGFLEEEIYKEQLKELLIISTHSDPIQMLVVMPFDDLKFCDSDDSTFRVDISSRFPVDRKYIKLLTFAPPVLLQERIQAPLDSCMILSSTRRLLQERIQAPLDSCMILS